MSVLSAVGLSVLSALVGLPVGLSALSAVG